MRRRLLIVGGYGFVGAALARHATEGYETAVCSRAAKPSFRDLPFFPAEITDAGQVLRACESFRPNAVVNVAAVSDIDKAEEQRELAYAINVNGARNIAMAAKALGARHLSFSSDAVFDGRRPEYREEDPPAPVNYYGLTKHEGEKAVDSAYPASILVRVSLVLGFPVDGGNSYLARLSAALKSGRKVACAVDEIRTPIDVDTLAESVLELLGGTHTGIFHIGSTQSADRYELARRLASQLGFDLSLVEPYGPGGPIQGKAPRHKSGVLSVGKAQALLKTKMLDLEETIRRAIG